MSRIVTKYKKCQSDISLTAACVVEKMDNNPAFSDAPVALAKLKKVLPKFQTGLVNALGRDKHMVAIKNNLKAIVLDLLDELAKYVIQKSKGDRIIILSSGFDANKERRKIGSAPSIGVLEVELGPPGKATVTARNITGARAYIHQYTTEPPGLNTVWISEEGTEKRYTYEGLISEKRYWFRVVAIGSRSRKAYSPIVSKVIQ